MKDNSQPFKIHNFTIAYSGRVNVLITDIKISLPILPNTNPTISSAYPSKAIWDTGATGSVITKKAAKALNLMPISRMQVHGVNGISTQNVYLVSITLPNNVIISPVRVTECDNLNGPFDVLIGMEIISNGDFAVTNSNNQTVMSFRIPSISRIDFTNPENNHIHPDEHFLTREERRIVERHRNKHKYK